MRLSIVITAESGGEPLERTLVSVLENRPEACEVLVVTLARYDDPYDLADEVRFLQAQGGSGPIDHLRHALPHCRGGVVHLLRAGVEATEGWTVAALAHFADGNVAAVAPLVVDSSEPLRVVSAGLDFSHNGLPLVRAAGEAIADVPSAVAPIVAPTLSAAFFRQAALVRCGERFDLRLRTPLADIDWGLTLREAGYAALFEPGSRVHADAQPQPQIATARDAWQAERLFWRHAGATPWTRSPAAHVAIVAAECVRHWGSPAVAAARAVGMTVGGMRAMLAGRLLGRRHVAAPPDERAAPIAHDDGATRTMQRTDAPAPRTSLPLRGHLDRRAKKQPVA